MYMKKFKKLYLRLKIMFSKRKEEDTFIYED